MQSHYSINVSLNGRHLFATAEHSIHDENTAEQVYRALRDGLPEKDGYKIDCTYWTCSGRQIDISKWV